jgi:hypothetical protein
MRLPIEVLAAQLCVVVRSETFYLLKDTYFMNLDYLPNSDVIVDGVVCVVTSAHNVALSMI